MGHLMEERVHPLRAVLREEKINVQGDLGHEPPRLRILPWPHVTQGAFHASTQPYGYVVREAPLETGAIEVPVEGSHVPSLGLGGAAPLLMSASPYVAGMAEPGLLEGLPHGRPLAHPLRRVTGGPRADAPFFRQHGEGIDDFRGRATVRLVGVENGASLCQ